MGNGIAGRQNEEKSIAMLAAQRQIYNDAKKYDWILITLSVWLPFSLSIILIFTESESLTLFSYILSLVSMVCSMLLSSYIKKKKELAGFIQQKFDTYTYKMTWDNRVFGVDKNVNHEIAIYSEKILGNDSEKARLYNWYTPIVDEKSLVTGILACQRENFSWDVGLRKRFRFASILTIVILCLIIVTIGIYLNETIYKLIWRFAFVVPMLQWIPELEDVKQIVNISPIQVGVQIIGYTTQYLLLNAENMHELKLKSPLEVAVYKKLKSASLSKGIKIKKYNNTYILGDSVVKVIDDNKIFVNNRLTSLKYLEDLLL